MYEINDAKNDTGETRHVLELKDVACVRGARTLFTGVTCQLRPGELLRVRGANGAGKTSLLRMLCGLLEPTQGQVLWRGRNIAALREEFGAELIYLGHAAALKDDLTPLENLQVACTLAAQPMATVDARRALDNAGLRGHQNTQVRRLSQGQRRRSALARLALAQTQARWAPLWVLDEPFNALDADACAWLAGLIQAQLDRAGTVVLTSHQDVPLGNAGRTPHGPHRELAL